MAPVAAWPATENDRQKLRAGARIAVGMVHWVEEMGRFWRPAEARRALRDHMA